MAAHLDDPAVAAVPVDPTLKLLSLEAGVGEHEEMRGDVETQQT